MGATMHTWKVGRAFAAKKLASMTDFWRRARPDITTSAISFTPTLECWLVILILNVISKMKSKGISLSQLIGSMPPTQTLAKLTSGLKGEQEAMDAVRNFFTATDKPVAITISMGTE
jgi:phosphomannomutase